MLNLNGVFVTTITPFKEKMYELDIEGARENIKFLLESRVSGIIPLGTVGEFSSLSVDERKTLVENVVDAANGKKPIIVGVSHTNFREVIDLAQHAKDCGVDAVMLVPPYYLKDTKEGLISFLELVSRKVDIAIILYNIPALSKVNLTPSFLEEIVEKVNNVIGIKDGTRDLSQFSETIRRIGSKLPVIAGAEELSLFGLVAGAVGVTSTIANFAPHLITDLYQAMKDGDLEKARSLFFGPILTFRHLDLPAMQQGIPVQIVHTKETMNWLGMAAGPVRPPLSPMSEQKRTQLRQILEKIPIVSMEKRGK